MRIITALLLTTSTLLASGWDERINSYIGTNVNNRIACVSETGGVYFVSHWDADVTGKPKPTIQQLIDQDTAIAEKKAQEEAAKQAKLLARHTYENAYFTLVKAVLTLAGDPRKDIVPIPKLSFDELDAILDVLYEEPSTEKRANKLALKLLSVNAALQRYDINWWDSATWHEGL